MRLAGVVAMSLFLSPLAWPQMSNSSQPGVTALAAAGPSASQAQPASTQDNQPPSYANYSIMLVSPAGGAVVLMHNPKNELEFVDVGSTNHAFSAGYVPVRAAEIGELVVTLKEEITRLTTENQRLQIGQSIQLSAPPSLYTQAELDAQRHAQMEAEKSARRQQLIQSWLMLRSLMPTPQSYQIPIPASPNANRLRTNCTTQHVGDTSYTDCH